MAVVDQTIAQPRPIEARESVLLKLHEWVITVDHKRLGLMYICSGLVFFAVAGIEASIMRWQLAFPNHGAVPPEVFNRLFTMHGTTMVFLVGMPIIIGMANFLVPLMIGARDLAFPRLNAFGFWLFLSAVCFCISAFWVGMGSTAPARPRMSDGSPTHRSPDAPSRAGTVPTTGSSAYSSRIRQHRHQRQYHHHDRLHAVQRDDLWQVAALRMADAGRVVPHRDCDATADRRAGDVAVRPISRIDVLRHPGRWFGSAVAALLLDLRPPRGLHPDSAGFAAASEIIPVFSRKVIFGYPMMVAATISIAFISLGVWAHHMFTVGMSSTANTFFVASTMLIAVPTGIKIFNWLGTMYGGRIRFATPMLFCIAFLFQFLIAGLTGIMLSVALFDWQLSDSYFVVAHFHYVLIGACCSRSSPPFTTGSRKPLGKC